MNIPGVSCFDNDERKFDQFWIDNNGNKVSDSEYFGDHSLLSFSMLSVFFLQSKKLFQKKYMLPSVGQKKTDPLFADQQDEPEAEESRALYFGKAFHHAIATGNDQDIVKIPSFGRSLSNPAKDKWMAENASKFMLKEKEYEKFAGMIESFRINFGDLFLTHNCRKPGVPEDNPVMLESPYAGSYEVVYPNSSKELNNPLAHRKLGLKIKFDSIQPLYQTSIDVKTIDSYLTKDNIKSAIRHWKYDLRLAFYKIAFNNYQSSEGDGSNGLVQSRIIFVSKKYPYDCQLVDLSGGYMDASMNIVHDWLRRYAATIHRLTDPEWSGSKGYPKEHFWISEIPYGMR